MKWMEGSSLTARLKRFPELERFGFMAVLVCMRRIHLSAQIKQAHMPSTHHYSLIVLGELNCSRSPYTFTVCGSCKSQQSLPLSAYYEASLTEQVTIHSHLNEIKEVNPWDDVGWKDPARLKTN